MNTATVNASISTMQLSGSSSERSSLARLYLIRGLLAVAWAALFARAHASLGAVAIGLPIIYPAIDAVSSLVDYRATPNGSQRKVTAFNGVPSTLAAIAMGVASGVGVAAALAVFGARAVVSGAAQLMVGLRRRGPQLGRQWPMLIAGGLSFLVGISYVIQATGDQPSLDVLAVYATGGGVFFIVQSALLAWRTPQQQAATG